MWEEVVIFRFSFAVLCGLTVISACGGGDAVQSGASGGASSVSGGAPSGGDGAGGAPSSGAQGNSGGTSTGGAAGGSVSAGGGDSGGAGGSASGGAAGAGASSECAFDIRAALSDSIPTVGIVEWSTDFVGFSEARVEFTLDDPEEGELNVGSGGPISASSGQALLLGLKPERSYTYRIELSGGGATCTSPDHSITTGPLDGAPIFTQTLDESAGSRENGFILICGYQSAQQAWIVDADGEVVWMASAPAQCSRAHMDWSGESMWFLRANPSQGATGEVLRVKMDGSSMEPIAGLERSHHDFVALPGGAMAFLVWAEGSNESSDLVERSADGTLSTIARLDSTGFVAASASFHANALRYYERDDSFTVSDLYVSAILKLSREGVPQWQVGEACPDEPNSNCADATVLGTHGHHLLEDGRLLVFRGRMMPSPVVEYALSLGEELFTAELGWSYTSEGYSMTLGDVQRLGNGNTLITYSNQSEFHEVSPSGEVVRRLRRSGQFGYASFRETLYGPPPQ